MSLIRMPPDLLLKKGRGGFLLFYFGNDGVIDLFALLILCEKNDAGFRPVNREWFFLSPKK
jgi:hypothetical protein